MKLIKISTPLSSNQIKNLKPGQEVLLSGLIYTARDTAHKRLYELISRRKTLPVKLKETIIYYCGPNPARPGMAIGSCGPTTSGRMDAFTPCLLGAGLKAMIGKGRRSEQARQAIKRYKAIYFIAPAGCGALLAERVKKARLVAFIDLGPEAIYEFQVEDFPLIVGIDSRGNDIYRRGVFP